MRVMYVRVEVEAGARKESFIKNSVDSFKIMVREEAKQNRANKRAKELLAFHFGVPGNRVRLTAGHRSPRKVFSIEI